jgi:hypothetical protein
MSNVIFEQAHQSAVALKPGELVDTKSVQVVIDLNNSFSVGRPELFDLISKNECIFLAVIGIQCFQHVFGINDRTKGENQLLLIDASFMCKLYNAFIIDILGETDLINVFD